VHQAKTVVLRGGTHYIAATIELGPQHSGLHLLGHPNEEAVISGGVELNVTWKPYNVSAAGATLGADRGNSTWVTQDGYNYVFDEKFGTKKCPLLGKTKSALACQTLCKADPACHAYTWHNGQTGKKFKYDCVGRTDGHYLEHADKDHFSGHDGSATPFGPSPAPSPSPAPPPPPAGPPNVYVADVTGQVADVLGLQLDGVRATRARYPNIPGGVEVSCGYDCMIAGAQADWTPPDPNKYGPVKFYTDSTEGHYRNDTDNWFNEYMIGINGLCSV
jgi:hypothetical protein